MNILVSGHSNDAVWVDVAIIGKELTVSPQMAQCLLKHYPSLAEHACKSSGEGRQIDLPDKLSQAPFGAPGADVSVSIPATATFGSKLIGALLPHALEHLAIDLLVQAHPGGAIAGNTSWLVREEQTMRVRIQPSLTLSYEEVLDALTEATGHINEFLATCRPQMNKETLS